MNLEPHHHDELSTYLITGGVGIQAQLPGSSIHIEPGSRIAIEGSDTYKKNLFADLILGYQNLEGSSVEFTLGEQSITSSAARKSLSAILGRSPLMVGDTIQEAVLWRTNGVRKEALYRFVERMYGTTLRARTNPANPLVDKNLKPIPVFLLNSREHLELAEINLMLAKLPLVTLDFSSPFMHKALAEGFRPARELAESGKTLLVILPSGNQSDLSREELRTKTEQMLGFKFTGTIQV